jgi:hypothetical protein
METWYCWKGGGYIVSRDVEGLLIRGIPESMIFEVKAESKIKAIIKANKIIKQVDEDYCKGLPI